MPCSPSGSPPAPRSMVEPHKAFWGGYSSYVADLDGHLWELAHNPYASIDDDGRLVMGGAGELTADRAPGAQLNE